MIGDDDILREIRATREAFAAEHNYNVREMVAALRAEDAASGRVVVSFPPRPAEDVSLGAKPAATRCHLYRFITFLPSMLRYYTSRVNQGSREKRWTPCMELTSG